MSSLSSVCDTPAIVLKPAVVNDTDSSEEPPREDWSSVEIKMSETNIKRCLYEQGLYKPGSGEVCAKYLTLSSSSVYRHAYYNYPGVKDPGIEEALFMSEPQITYPDDGQELYINLCKEGNICPIKRFYRQLLEEKINLSYYGIHSKAYRALALSLKSNRFVSVLNLTDNWITQDGCFHFGEILLENITLSELNLYGCRIGPEGARRLFINLHLNRSLRILNLCKNQLGDLGVEFLAKAIYFGSNIVVINLSSNELTAKAVLSLVQAFRANNKVTHLDLSWNNILSPNAVYSLCSILSKNSGIEELNLSWNSLSGSRVGKGLKVLLQNRNIKHINVSNNRLSTPAVKPIVAALEKAISLVTLNLSYNPFTPADALKLLLRLRDRPVKLQNLLLDNVNVTDQFIEQLDIILSFPFRKDTVITHGFVKNKLTTKRADMREIVLNRIDFLCNKSKKKKIDFVAVVLSLFSASQEPLDTKMFTREMRKRGAQLDEDLLGKMYELFAGPATEKAKFVDLPALIEYLKRKWPDRIVEPKAEPTEVDK